jgi:hypothetical protein
VRFTQRSLVCGKVWCCRDNAREACSTKTHRAVKREPQAGASLKIRGATSRLAGDAQSQPFETVVGEVCSRGGGDPVP